MLERMIRDLERDRDILARRATAYAGRDEMTAATVNASAVSIAGNLLNVLRLARRLAESEALDRARGEELILRESDTLGFRAYVGEGAE